MFDRRGMLLGAAAAMAAGAAWAGPGRPAPVPDLTGTWTHATYTDLERPKELGKLVLTPAEAEAFEAPRRALNGMPPSKPDEIGQAESEFNERGSGLLRIGGQIRSSLIVDPPDGKIPYLKSVRAELELDLKPADRKQRLDNPEERPVDERCLVANGSSAPLIPGPDTNLVQIVQTPGEVAILSEKYHDVRIVRLGPGSSAPQPPSWLGASTGRWEGATLVVETAGFATTGPKRRMITARTRVAESFTRTGPDEILYRFTVEDPSLFTRPWRAEMLLVRARGQLYEYACHEGNYGLPDILHAARRMNPPAVAAATAGR